MNLVLNTVKLHAKYHGLILLFSGHIQTFGQKEPIPPIGRAEKEFVYLILIFNTVPFFASSPPLKFCCCRLHPTQPVGKFDPDPKWSFRNR